MDSAGARLPFKLLLLTVLCSWGFRGLFGSEIHIFPKQGWSREAKIQRFTKKVHNYVCAHLCEHENEDCAICHCDAACVDYSDCCPEVRLQNTSHTSTPYKCEHVLAENTSYFMETTCPPDQEFTELGEKCRNTTVSLHREPPVTDRDTKVTYKNRFCAQCHNVTSYQPWSLEIDCSSGDVPRAAAASSREELLDLVLREKICPADVLPPEGVPARKCSLEPEILLSSCNVTGRWRVFDQDLVRACAAFKYVYQDARNIFCKICNEEEDLLDYIGNNPIPPVHVPLTAILNLLEDEAETSALPDQRRPGVEEPVSCAADHFLDPASGRCRLLTCASGKMLRGGTCINIFSKSAMISYDLILFSTLISRTSVLKGLYRNFRPLLQLHSMKIIPGPNVWLKLDVFYSEYSTKLTSATCFKKTARIEMVTFMRIFLLKPVILDYVESMLLTYFRRPQRTSLPAYGRLVRSLSASNTASKVMKNTLACPHEEVLSKKAHQANNVIDYRQFPIELEDKSDVHIIRQLGPLLLCPQVTLEPHEYEYFNQSNSLFVRATNITFSFPNFMVGDGLARICVDDYLAGFECTGQGNCVKLMSLDNVSFQLDSSKIRADSASDAAGYLSFSCTIISLTFLALTLLAYVLFKKIRTLAGICLICMVSVLFLAQAVFEFGAEQTEIDWVCITLGVLAHYLWLSATFWMTACTILMFCRLMFPLRAMVELHSRVKVLSASCAFSFVSPAVIVGAVLGTSVSVHGDLGYGGGICYIKRAVIRRFALALPVGCLVLVNLCLFLVTVVRLRQESVVSPSGRHKVGLFACTKLSVITGLSWVSLFTYEWLRFEIVAYVAIILFGMHGVVVFLAFAFEQYANHLRAWWSNQRSSTTAPPPKSTQPQVEANEEGIGGRRVP